MADWSEIFEQRLQTVLQDGKRADANTFSSAFDVDLRPPPTSNKVGTVQRPAAPSDPTNVFFESIRNQSRPSNRPSTSYAVGGSGRRHSFQYSEPSTSRGVFTPAAQMIRASSPVDDIERPDIKELHESYSNRAEELQSEATDRMNQARDVLEAELARMVEREDAFLSTVAGKQFHFSQPAEAWMVKVQMRDKVGVDDNDQGGPVEKDERIVDRIAAVRTTAATLESDLERLWAEWGQAHTEATDVLNAMISGNDGGDGADDEFNEILAKVEKELNAAAAEAIKEMNENEKTFKNIILAEECKLAQMMLSRQSKYD
ncbi:GTPase activating factor [Sporothrix eucalyptigena]|uniref:GTPase activating factor n=1 Tax=Sporothrix eucalyptigena TaxID=1812306 RepID=A0ABP0BL02_9PEZI